MPVPHTGFCAPSHDGKIRIHRRSQALTHGYCGAITVGKNMFKLPKHEVLKKAENNELCKECWQPVVNKWGEKIDIREE